VLAELGHEVREVRRASELTAAGGLDGLVLPGGESGAQLRLIERHDLWHALELFVAAGRPLLCTCAGLILAARSVTHPEQRSFGWIDVSVMRNGWGRQIDSFEAVSDGLAPRPLVFIRAPRIRSVGPMVETLATLEGEPVLVREGHRYGATFHPELTSDLSLHAQVFGDTRDQRAAGRVQPRTEARSRSRSARRTPGAVRPSSR
jgi:5'-phosphate synthase pdxT subunit